MKTLLCTAAMALALAAGPALAQTTPATNMTATATTQADLSQQDRDFAKKAAQGGLMEVELGKLASDKASSQDVKKFGQRMVDDHSKANSQLKQVAEKKKLDLPSQLSDEHKQMKERLSGLSGEQFDRQYMQEMVKDHKEDVELFRKQAAQGQDADLKRFASETLPVLEQHLQLAQDIAAGMQPMASAAGGASSTAGQSGAAAGAPGSGATSATPSASASKPATTTTTAAAPSSAASSDMKTAAKPGIDSKLGAMTAKEIVGKDVVNADGKEIGEIEDLVIDDNKTVHAVIGVGGFLGIGEKDVLVPFSQLRMGADNAIMMSEATEEDLKKLPEYKKDDYQALPRDRRILER